MNYLIKKIYKRNNLNYVFYIKERRQIMVEKIFEGIADTITNFISTLNTGLTGVVSLFYANNSLTVLGVLATIVVGVSLTWFGFSLIMRLIRLRG